MLPWPILSNGADLTRGGLPFAGAPAPGTPGDSLTDFLAFVGGLLRGTALAGQALALGGLAFALLILRPVARRKMDSGSLLRPTLRLTILGAVTVAIAQYLSVSLQIGLLADEMGWPAGPAFATPSFRASLVRLLACLGLVVGCRFIRRRPGAKAWWAALIGCALILVGGSAWMSHAAARSGGRGILLGLDALHQIAAGVWVGGLVHLLAFARRKERPWPGAVLRRFSALALTAVAILAAAGLGLSLYYVDGIQALLGTAYGVMLMAKGVLLAGLLVLGGMNFLAVRRLPPGAEAPPPRLRQFVEVEVGLGIAVFFVAASFASHPPAVDVVADRATLAEVATRFTPQWPRLRSPSVGELPIPAPDAPRTAEDMAWSEYNHHVAGIFVLAMGFLAVLARARWARWARHWPLLFLGLAGFLLVRNDPDAWPLGPIGFWEGMAVRTILQHRVFALLTVAFGLFEWMVRTGRARSPRWALVFPMLAAVGSGFLLTHAHTPDDLKASFLVEVTHIPLGLLGIFVGWTRWLELRLPPPKNRGPAWLWPLGLALIGIMLLLYRES